MSRCLELLAFCFTLLVVFMGIAAGSTFVPRLVQTVDAALHGKPWEGPALALLVAGSCGPILIGAGMAGGMSWLLWTARGLCQRMKEFPEEPWLWRTEWRRRQVRLSNKVATGFLVSAIICYLLIIAPLGIYLASIKNAGMVYTFLVALLLFLLLFTWRQWANRKRNRSVLTFETLPGQINGEFCGVVTLPLEFPNGTAFHVRLMCEETLVNHARSGNTNDGYSMLTNTQNGRSRSDSQTSKVYDETKLITPQASQMTPGSTSVPVSFVIPGNLPSTGTITQPGDSGIHTASTRHYC